MGKARSITVKGTDGPDFLEMPVGRNLLNTSFDGGRGSDTLDLSDYQSDGVFVIVQYGMAKAKSTVADSPFVGAFGHGDFLDGAPTATGTIRNIENVIGTSGDDYLVVHTLAGVAKRVDGGDGDDVVHSLGGDATLVGGTGSDWLVSYFSNNVLYGGEDDGDPNSSDGVRDYFYLGSAPTIMDFEVGVDHILIEMLSGQDIAPYYSPVSAIWVDEAGGASLYVNGVLEVTLANINAATAQGIQFGVVASPINGEVWGGVGDDMLYAGGHTTVTRVLAGEGNDIIVNFDLAYDTLVLADGMNPVWSNTMINGAQALVGTYAGGSVTFQGLSMDDVDAMMIEGSGGSLSPSEDPAASAWSLPSDFAMTSTTSSDWWI